MRPIPLARIKSGRNELVAAGAVTLDLNARSHDVLAEFCEAWEADPPPGGALAGDVLQEVEGPSRRLAAE